jgi:hypothetical protein
VEDESVYFKRAKYIGVKYMAWYLKQEMPEAPPVDFVHTGAWRKWARSRRFVNRRNTHLWYSILQAKRCAVPLGKEMVLATYEKHRKAMSLEDPISEDALELVFDGLLGVLEPIRRKLTASYETNDDLNELSETSWAPSQAACFEASRLAGGQKQVLIDHAVNPLSGQDVEEDFFDRRDQTAHPSIRVDPDLVRMQFYHKIVINGQVRTNIVIEYYEYPDAMDRWNDNLADAILCLDTGRPLNCEIYGILEPLKVRVISKGEAVPYYAAKELQKRLHAIMREMDCFRLIGRPLCPTDLMDCAEHRVNGVGEGQHLWFSVDYSSATDCLSASLSSKILRYLIQDLPERMQEIWVRVLAPHVCHYPPVKGGEKIHDELHCAGCRSVSPGEDCPDLGNQTELAPVEQKNGQLMGSPLSFPILCLANLGLYLEVIHDDPRPLREKLKGVLVNGDDMLYVAPESLWDWHVALGRHVGLVMTPGKAYKHRVFANANSTCFHYNLDREGATPWQISFLNTGLLFGQNKVLQKDTGLDVMQQSNAVSVMNQVLKGALPGKEAVLLKSYLNRHKDKVNAICAGRNLFIPTSLGGMGVNPPPKWKWSVTDRQRLTASARVRAIGPYAEFGFGPRRSPKPLEYLERVHPYMIREGTAERQSLHRYDRRIVQDKTMLKSYLLSQSVYITSTPVPTWRRSFYRSGLVIYEPTPVRGKAPRFTFESYLPEEDESSEENESLPMEVEVGVSPC